MTAKNPSALLAWRLLVITTWMFCSFSGKGQSENTPTEIPSKFVIKSWSTGDGLPHLSVTTLAQTKDGYIWIGTLAGLVRFDSVGFKIFTPQNCPELPKSRISGIFEGADGTLFIATARGGGLVALRALEEEIEA